MQRYGPDYFLMRSQPYFSGGVDVVVGVVVAGVVVVEFLPLLVRRLLLPVEPELVRSVVPVVPEFIVPVLVPEPIVPVPVPYVLVPLPVVEPVPLVPIVVPLVVVPVVCVWFELVGCVWYEPDVVPVVPIVPFPVVPMVPVVPVVPFVPIVPVPVVPVPVVPMVPVPVPVVPVVVPVVPIEPEFVVCAAAFRAMPATSIQPIIITFFIVELCFFD